MLHIHNSMTGRKEPFKPIRPGEVRMYVCGMTVYDYCHIGHGRMLIVFDLLRRHLRESGYSVTFVRNITDIDDKIIRRAEENGEPIASLTERFIRAYHEDCAALGVELGDHEPKATEYLPQIIDMVARLIERGNAYRGDSGDVYFSVASFAPYGQLSGKRLADLRAGARVEVDESKRDPLDFVLWKAAKPGEPAWESPWGPGRPGWHIECSAMSVALLGPHFDIHGGGMDLKFPHHENEIAQTCAACGSEFVNFWVHNGFVRLDEEKMSKSLGNFFTVREVLELVRDPEVIRYFMLSSHYRGPINYSLENLEQADAALERLYNALQDVEAAPAAPVTAATQRFLAAMDDDLNTPVAIAELQGLARAINTLKASGDSAGASAAAGELVALGRRLGLLALRPKEFLRKAPKSAALRAETGTYEISKQNLGLVVHSAFSEEEIETLIDQRSAARAAKNFRESDRIRDVLGAQGIVLEDRPGGQRTLWRRGH
jgi:cysteinyl-tRNA synthetase